MTRARLDLTTRTEVAEVTATSRSIHFVVGTALNTKKGRGGHWKPPDICNCYHKN